MENTESGKSKNTWDRFLGSGRIEDYLLYTGDMEKPELGTVELVAMSNAGALSGIGGVDTFGSNNMAAIVRQDLINADASVRTEESLKSRKGMHPTE